MNAQLAIQKILQSKLFDAQSTNAQYSLRAFSLRVGIPPGAISEILNGKRNVSHKLAERIAQKLLLDPQERSELFAHFPKHRAPGARLKAGEENADDYQKLSAAQFKIIAEWEHLAILSLINTQDFQSDTGWIALRLGISHQKANEATRRLLEVGMLALNMERTLTRTAKKLRTTDDVADIGLKRSHEKTLDLARESLHRDEVSIRDHTALTLAIDPEKMSAAKEMIR